jgi:hypothetical protein
VGWTASLILCRWGEASGLFLRFLRFLRFRVESADHWCNHICFCRDGFGLFFLGQVCLLLIG